MEGGEIIEKPSARARSLGRVALEDIIATRYTDEILVRRPTSEIDEGKVRLQVEEAGVDRVKIRSVLTCQTKPRHLRPCATAATWPAAAW